MTVTALLTGRGNNTLKDKNVLPVLGRPLLYYPAIAAKHSRYVASLYVSSDDDKILNAVSEIGYKKIRRPDEYALPTSQHIDAILHALDYMKQTDDLKPDILIVLMANSGIIKTEWIDSCIEMILNNPEVSSVVPVVIDQDHHPFRAKQMSNDGFLTSFFDFSNQSISTNRQDLPVCYYLCHNFWVLNISKSIDLLPQGQPPWTFLGDKILPLVIEDSFDVHTEEDITKTEKWLLKQNFSYLKKR